MQFKYPQPYCALSPKYKNLKALIAIFGMFFSILFGHSTYAEPLKVGTNVWPGYEPFHLAKELGYYDDDIHLVEFTSATQVLQAFRNGTIHVAALTLDEVLLLAQHNLNPNVILINDISHGGDVILSKPEITSVQELKGKRVGVESMALGAFVLTRALQIHDTPISEIEIVSMDVIEHAQAFKDYNVDAVVTFEPTRSILLAQGAKQIFDSTQIPGEIVDVTIISDNNWKKFQPQLVNLQEGWFKALQDIVEKPEESAKIMSKRLKIPPEEVTASFEGLVLPSKEENVKLMTGASAPLKTTMKSLADTMINAGLLKRYDENKNILNPGLVSK